MESPPFCKIVVNLEQVLLPTYPDLSEFSARFSLVGKTLQASYPFVNIEVYSCLLPTDEQLTVELLHHGEAVCHADLALAPLIESGSLERWVTVTPEVHERPSVSFSSIYERKERAQGRFFLRATYEELPVTTYHSCGRCQCLERIAVDAATESQQLRESEVVVKAMASKLGQPLDLASADIALEVNSLVERSGALSVQEAQHLRSLILGVNTKLKSVGALQHRLQQCQATASSSKIAREQMHKTLEEAAAGLHDTWTRQEAEWKKLREERDWAVAEAKNQHKAWQEQCQINEQQAVELAQNAALLAVQQDQLKNAESQKQTIAELTDQVAALEASRQSLKEELGRSLQEFEQTNNSLAERVSLLDGQVTDLTQELHATEQKLESTQKERDSLNTHSIEQDSLVLSLQAQLQTQEDMIFNYKQAESALQQTFKAFDAVQATYEEVKTSFQQAIDKVVAETQRQAEQAQAAAEAYAKLDSVAADQNTVILELNEEKENLIMRSKATEQYRNVHRASAQLQEDIREAAVEAERMKEGVYKELGRVTEFMCEQASHVLETQLVNNKLQQAVENRNEEIHTLRQIVTDLRRKMQLYVPVKDDPIDVAVADYSNTSLPELPFVREDLGIYLFGTKRVFVKLEHGRVVVRVGGGFMKIEDFVSFYSPVELDKFENKLREEANSKRSNILGQISRSFTSEKTKRAARESLSKYSTFYAISPKLSPMKTKQVTQSPKKPKRRSQEAL